MCGPRVGVSRRHGLSSGHRRGFRGAVGAGCGAQGAESGQALSGARRVGRASPGAGRGRQLRAPGLCSKGAGALRLPSRSPSGGVGIPSIASGSRDWRGWRQFRAEGSERGRLCILGVRTSFILKRAAGSEAAAAVGVLRAAPTSSCCGRCAAFSSKNAAPPPPPPSSVVWFNQTSSDLCRNLQLPGFLFLPGADNSRFVFEAGEGN